MDKRLDDIDEKLNYLETILKRIEKKLERFEGKLDGELLNECKKMGAHIDFVESVYDNVKNPLGFICKKVNKMVGTDKQYELTEQ